MQLPNPDLDNTEGRSLSVSFKRSMNGARHTTVKSSERKSLVFTWTNLGYGKLVEAQEFFKLYAGDHMFLEDFRGDIWNVIFDINPISITVDGRSVNSGGPRNESGSLTLEFLGVQIT
jgi:hypothetical protein